MDASFGQHHIYEDVPWLRSLFNLLTTVAALARIRHRFREHEAFVSIAVICNTAASGVVTGNCTCSQERQMPLKRNTQCKNAF